MKTIVLHEAIQSLGQTITEITFREPKAGDLKVMDEAKGNVGKDFKIAEALTGIPEPDLEKMCLKDWKSIADELSQIMDLLME